MGHEIRYRCEKFETRARRAAAEMANVRSSAPVSARIQIRDFTNTSSWIPRLSPANDGEIQVAFGVDDQLADLRKNLFERLDIETAGGHLRGLGVLGCDGGEAR